MPDVKKGAPYSGAEKEPGDKPANDGSNRPAKPVETIDNTNSNAPSRPDSE